MQSQRRNPVSNQDKIKDKIKKLLRLSRSCNENEAKAAMAKAQELMMQDRDKKGRLLHLPSPISSRKQ